MSKNIAINGFGRIGKNLLRVLLQDKNSDLKPVAINVGPCAVEHTAYSFKYDTILGTFNGEVHMDGDYLVVDDHRIKLLSALDPKDLHWKDLDIDWVVDACGQF
ncbi:MAG TPA: glyceraldehyde 3-phosphate dehydrogenase NAD-binding domain-containing protein, partial [Candidatus Babeliales bacterium]|nr:glyceraldehyde 3-phosphate dehydrogenase NAD-binding domain-containing protein [Candidatus Babeliales bacterium]